ncbi:MAG: LacI family DNA-binding transcriptional regulator [Opitutales bacterium]|jgi:DNA-binding LacI/PurR family transcriptional regulator|nr:LacI family DNA-binding transcriptional regulator [Opitutales bacterium]
MPSLTDVAKHSGFSIATVSRVINESDKVTEDTRVVVQRSMDELGYLPNRVARRLRQKGGPRHLLGLILPDIQNPFNAELARGIEDVAYANQFAVLLCNSDDKLKKEQFYINVMRAESVDGVILPPNQESDSAVVDLIDRGMPVVIVDRALRDVHADTVEVDNFGGSHEAVSHLIQLGHKRIGLIAGPESISNSRRRRRGYEQALKEANISNDEDLIRTGDFKQDSGRKLAHELLQQASPPTALFVSNNLMAVGALEAIHSLNLKVPEEVALIGFDDHPWAEALDPPLTVVRQPAYKVGQAAAEMLLNRLTNPDTPVETRRLKPHLVLRKSC